MKIKYLLPCITAVAIGTVLVVSSFKFKGNELANYTPRSSNSHSANWAGAAEYYRMIKANIYTGEIEADDINRMTKALESKKNNKSLGLEWQSMGPSNVGGRTRAILIYNENPNIVFAGSVSGGLFKSTNAGNLWQRVQSFDTHLPIGSICRLGNGSIYVGTGTSHDGISGNGGSGFLGGGLFKSADDGATWVKVFGNDDLFQDNSQNDWKFVDALVADPSDPNKLWIGKTDGLYAYIDGNPALEAAPAGLGSATCEDVEISGDVMVASIKSLSVKVYVSTDGGNSFFLTSVPSTSGGRIAVTVSKDDNNYMYAASVTNTGQLKGIYASIDKGTTWYDISGPATEVFNPYGEQGIYDNCIITVPGFPKRIIIGGLTMFSWELIGEIPSISYFEPRTVYFGTNQDPYYVHPDIHEFQWAVYGDSAVLYVGCDGGVFKSSNLGATYYSANRGYTTGQFYGIGISNDGKVAGGLQDNGTQYLKLDEGVDETLATTIGGGDGFDTEISNLNGDFIFTTLYNNVLARSTDEGNSASAFAGLDIPSGIDGNMGGDFYTDIRLYENKNNPFSQAVVPVVIFPGMEGYKDTTYTNNGNIIEGFVKPNTQVSYESATGFQLSQTTTDTLFYYSTYNYINYNDSSIVDTITTVTSVDTVFANDTTFTYVNLGEVPAGSDNADTCYLFLGDTACYDLDTTFTVQLVIVDIIENTTTTYLYDYETTLLEDVSDTLFAKDNVTSILALSAQLGSGEIWVTREPLKTNSNSVWVKAVSGVGSTVTSMEWSPDGNSLYIGFDNGSVKRISNWNNAWTAAQMTFGNPQYVLTSTVIKASSAGAVLGIGVDYSQGTGIGASEKVMIAQGGYGGGEKVKVSNNAASATSATTANFTSIWNVEAPFDEMPVYSVVMDKSNNQKIIAGTEYGIWSSDNGGDSWEESNGGDMVRVPVFEIRQQWKPSTEVFNSGMIYAGTHGAGIMKSDNLYEPTSISDNTKKENLSGLLIYPNPIQSGNGSVQFELKNNSNVVMNIYNTTGKLVENITKPNMPIGKNTIEFNADQYASGTYLVQLVAEGSKKMGKFVVFK